MLVQSMLLLGELELVSPAAYFRVSCWIIWHDNGFPVAFKTLDGVYQAVTKNKNVIRPYNRLANRDLNCKTKTRKHVLEFHRVGCRELGAFFFEPSHRLFYLPRVCKWSKTYLQWLVKRKIISLWLLMSSLADKFILVHWLSKEVTVSIITPAKVRVKFWT